MSGSVNADSHAQLGRIARGGALNLVGSVVSAVSSFLIVVAVGGLGSLKGTLLAALVIGIIDTAGKYTFPVAGNLFIYAITAIVLLYKPTGFFGRE